MPDLNFKRILDKLDEGIHIVDQSGETIYYNKKAAEIDGLNRKEVIGKNIFSFYPSLTSESSTLMQALRKQRTVSGIKQTFINLKGKKITTVNTTIPLSFADGSIGAMEISQNLTELASLLNNVQGLESGLTTEKQLCQKSCGRNNTRYQFEDIIGTADNFTRVTSDALKAARTNSAVLLIGETGTGKELFAQSIHNASQRQKRPFIAQNCAALPRDLLEGLLFGTEKGGFTGAKSRAGLFEQAAGGTVLLDEINAMDLALQAKLLRVLQEKMVRRIGGKEEKEIDVRFIATINMTPEEAIENNYLRKDLYYRLSVINLAIPPLRERRKDIPLLVNHFIDYYNQQFCRQVSGIANNLLALFINYDWPGNVRELQHVIEATFNLLQSDEELQISNLPNYLQERMQSPSAANEAIVEQESLPELDFYLEKVEKDILQKALLETERNISQAARLLSISRQSLQYKLKKYNL